MPIREYQVARKAITKDKLATDARVKVETQLPLCRGPGANITGNAGTAYSSLPGGSNIFRPGHFRDIDQVLWRTIWNPETTAGGIELYDGAVGVRIAVSEPGAAGWRTDEIDVTSYFKALTADASPDLRTKGDGTTAPTITYSFVRIIATLT